MKEKGFPVVPASATQLSAPKSYHQKEEKEKEKVENPIQATSTPSSMAFPSSSAAAAYPRSLLPLWRRRSGLLALLLLIFLSFRVPIPLSLTRHLLTATQWRNVSYVTRAHIIRDSFLLIVPPASIPQAMIHVPSIRSAVSLWLFSDHQM